MAQTDTPAKSSGSASHPKGSSTHHSSKAQHTSASTSKHKGKHSKKTSSRRGQQKIDTDRAEQIQEALIREHYMSGQPSGKMDATTEAALRRFQADNGWQDKTVPDSRALIKLGLGPNQDHLLNPESAMTTAPEAARATTAPSSEPARSNAASTTDSIQQPQQNQ
jgi:peptidoglycan hydrolase-like protein with peptidoglycan-binding domain